jgi:3-hydroxybutyryl-CoA dehydrogenase
MNIVVLANDEQWDILTKNTVDIQWVRATVPFSITSYTHADGFFILNTEVMVDYIQTGKPVFLNSVTHTLKEANLPGNILRINGWNTFLNRPLWEIAGSINDESKLILKKINKNFITVADEPGLVAARIIAMIINEAYFALGDKISDKPAIDTAMKLGTNYPYGPFEWAEKIGLQNIYELLSRLSITINHYKPAPALVKEIQQKL